MADLRKGLHLIPEHMREAILLWIEHGEPHPNMLGSFLGALLANNFIEAAARADAANQATFFQWAVFLRSYAPIGSYGGPAQLEAWYARHHKGT